MPRRALVVALLALVAAFTAPAPDDRGRPVILMVHGRGMIDRDTAALRSLWLDGLDAGAKDLTSHAVLTDRDVRLVWYADVLDPQSPASCSYSAGDPRARRDTTDPELRQFVSMVGAVLGALTNVVSDKESATELRSLSGDAEFLTDSHKRCAAEQRLADAIDRATSEGRPVIVVAHSLGSLVAYDYLSSRRDSSAIARVVTIGSPLGSADLRHLLIGGDSTESFGLPASVKAWINVRASADPLAMPLSFGREIMTTPPPDETDAHEMIGYLRNSATASAILSGWCTAFVGTAPGGCTELAR
ncbi:MAG: esterase/lipase family protein [Gemmatimonadaceae bacterium]